MSGIPANELKISIAKSAGRCAFRGCGKSWSLQPRRRGSSVFWRGVPYRSPSRQGPRANIIVTEGQRDHHTNLILMCQEHHLLIDRRPEVYSLACFGRSRRNMKTSLLGSESQVLQAPGIQAKAAQHLLCSNSDAGQVLSAPCAFKAGMSRKSETAQVRQL